MPSHDPLPEISPFHEIEVWCTFTRRWVPGFWLDGLEPDGSIRLRRGIDQAPLSGSVPASSVRTRQPAPGRIVDLRSSGRSRRPDTDELDPCPDHPAGGRTIKDRPNADQPSADHPSAADGAVDLRSGDAVTPWSG